MIPKSPLWPRVQAGVVHMLEASSPEELADLLRETDGQIVSLVTTILASSTPAEGAPAYISPDELDIVFGRLREYDTSLRENIQAVIDGQTVTPYQIKLW